MKKKHLLIALIAALLLTTAVNLCFTFYQKITSKVRSDVEVRLHEITSPNIISFNLQMQEQVNKVTTLADFLGSYGILDDETARSLLNATVENNSILRCAIALPDGSFITHDGKNEGNVSDSDFFIANMAGEFFITDPRPAVVDESKKVILFAAPIKKDGTVIGSVITSYLCDSMDTIFNFQFLNDDGRMLIVKEDGTKLMGSHTLIDGQQNALDYLRSKCTHRYHNPDNCLRLAPEGGIEALTFDGEKGALLVSYDSTSYNDWYMLSLVSEAKAASALNLLGKERLSTNASILLIILFYIVFLIYFSVTNRNLIDKKTGLFTLKSFKRKAMRVIMQSGRQNFVFLKLDVKNFKLINRIYNYAEGDRVIQNIAGSFRYLLDMRECPVARVGTDDFLFLLPYHGRAELDQLRERFMLRFRQLMGPHFTTAVEFPTGQYILTENDFPKPDIEEILEKVNFAHRAAKTRNMASVVDYEANLEKDALLEKSIVDQMSDALANNEFQLYLQPKVDVKTEKICGAEALCRWVVNGRIYLPPISFIPVLEKNGFIVKLDFYMFERTARKLKAIIDCGARPLPISVNFSICHLDDENFVRHLCEIADTYEVPHNLLEIELTESAVFEHMSQIKLLIEQLHKEGFTLSMDDFGSGYSCLALLKDLDVDVIKLDRGFFDVESDQSKSIIVISNIINLAKELGVHVVAEGVEVKEHVQMLRQLDCDMIQGFYYSHAIPEKDFILK